MIEPAPSLLEVALFVAQAPEGMVAELASARWGGKYSVFGQCAVDHATDAAAKNVPDRDIVYRTLRYVNRGRRKCLRCGRATESH